MFFRSVYLSVTSLYKTIFISGGDLSSTLFFFLEKIEKGHIFHVKDGRMHKKRKWIKEKIIKWAKRGRRWFFKTSRASHALIFLLGGKAAAFIFSSVQNFGARCSLHSFPSLSFPFSPRLWCPKDEMSLYHFMKSLFLLLSSIILAGTVSFIYLFSILHIYITEIMARW